MSRPYGNADRADGVARVLAALTAVAGLSALVAFTGGAIVWVRYQQAELPAEQAVAVTPKESLIATGGAALGLFALVGAIAVAVAYLIDHEGTRPRQAIGVTVLAQGLAAPPPLEAGHLRGRRRGDRRARRLAGSGRLGRRRDPRPRRRHPRRLRLPRARRPGRRGRGAHRAVRANRRTYIDYWWFLRYNRFHKSSASELCGSFLTNSKNCFDHEGDWEGVFRYSLSQIQHEEQRPVIFVANGSHASYPQACPDKCSQVAKLLGHALPEDNTDGTQPWGRNDAAECDQEPKCLQPLPSGSWGAFAGFWGSRKCTGRRSCRLGVPPRSPARQRRFNSPWCFSGPGLVLRCDGRLVG